MNYILYQFLVNCVDSLKNNITHSHIMAKSFIDMQKIDLTLEPVQWMLGLAKVKFNWLRGNNQLHRSLSCNTTFHYKQTKDFSPMHFEGSTSHVMVTSNTLWLVNRTSTVEQERKRDMEKRNQNKYHLSVWLMPSPLQVRIMPLNLARYSCVAKRNPMKGRQQLSLKTKHHTQM